MLLQRLLRRQGVFEDVVQEAYGDRCLVQPHLGQQVGDVERVDQVGLARGSNLAAMLAGRKDVRFLQQFLVEVRLEAFDFVEDVLEADHGRSRCNKPFIVAVPCRSLRAGCRRRLSVLAAFQPPIICDPRTATLCPLVRLLLTSPPEAGRSARLVSMKEVVVKRLYSVLVVVLLVALAVPTFAAPMPSKTAANQSLDSRAADLALVRDVAANQEVAKVLAARGFTQD